MQSYVHVLNGTRSTPSDRPSLREGTGPNIWLMYMSPLAWLGIARFGTAATGTLPITSRCWTPEILFIKAGPLDNNARAGSDQSANISAAYWTNRERCFRHFLKMFETLPALSALIFIGWHLMYPLPLFAVKSNGIAGYGMD